MSVEDRVPKQNLWLPPLVGVIVMLVMLGFIYSEYISGKIAYSLSSRNVMSTAYVQPPELVEEAQNDTPTLVIPKINVDAPTIFDESISDETGIQKALMDGVLHFPNTALPGEQGNSVIIGHSSGALWRPGNYKYVFALLEKLENEDVIYVDYEDVRYTYKVTGMQVVNPTEVSVLNQTDDYRLTLITCHPVGTNEQRLVITATQVSPKTDVNVKKTSPKPVIVPKQIPSESRGLWDTLHELL